MAGKKPLPNSTPPSGRSQRDRSPESLRRELTVWPEPVFGATHVRSLERLIVEFRKQDHHPNRRLFLDDVFIAYLLAFFNPAIRSLRTIEDFSQTRQAQKHLSIPKLCKSTLSDFNKLADLAKLQPILDHLRREVLKPAANPTIGTLSDLHRQVIAVDGTFLKAASAIVWAIRRSGGKTGARLDFHVDVETWIPELIVIPENQDSEAKTAETTITPGAIYVYDRGIFSFELIQAHAPKKGRFRDAGQGAGTTLPEVRDCPDARTHAGSPRRGGDQRPSRAVDRIDAPQSA